MSYAICTVRYKATEPGVPAGATCTRAATVTVEYGCIHEHIGSTETCGKHSLQIAARRTWCSACWLGEKPHKCDLIGRVKASP